MMKIYCTDERFISPSAIIDDEMINVHTDSENKKKVISSYPELFYL